MENPILVTGAAGRVGAVGRTVTEVLLKQCKAVRGKSNSLSGSGNFLSGYQISGKLEVSMKTTSLLLVIAVVAIAIGLKTLVSGLADKDDAPIFLNDVPQGYRDWKLIAVSRLTTSNGSGPAAKPDTPKSGSQLRAELGNDIAIKAYREGKLPFPDGAIIVALHWDEVSSEKNNRVLAQGFPDAGIQSFVPGSGLNMQFMVKDSKKYAATGGWGFGDFTHGKPSDEKVMKTCFACHMPAKNHDFVFTRYAP